MVKLRTRLFLAIMVLVCFGFFLLVEWLLEDLRPRYLETMEESMVDTATILASMLSHQIQGDLSRIQDFRTAFNEARKRTFSAHIYHLTKTHLDMRVYVTDQHGIVVFDSDRGRDEGKDYSRWNDVVKTLRGEYGARSTRADPENPATIHLYVAAPVMMGERIIGALTVCKPEESLIVFIHTAKRKIVAAGIIAAMFVLVLSLILSSWITQPIRKLTGYAIAVRDGKRCTMPDMGRNEIGQLGEAFEQMRDALEGKQYVENYLQTFTHEMKSPLSAIKGAAELLDEDMPREQHSKFIRNIRTETDRIQNLVDRLLQLSTLESRKELTNVQDMDLAEILAEAAESLALLLPARNITLTLDTGKPVFTRGNRFLVKQSIINLLQNAVDFSPREGLVTAELKHQGETAVLTISDNGPGVPQYAQGKIFDRFYSLKRPDTGKKSSGLGLPFVREVTLLHKGTVTLKNRPQGGAKATLKLPLLSKPLA